MLLLLKVMIILNKVGKRKYDMYDVCGIKNLETYAEHEMVSTFGVVIFLLYCIIKGLDDEEDLIE